LLAALIVYTRRHHHPMHGQLWQWAALMFVLGFVMPSVNNWAHAGGFAGGWLTAQAMGSSERRESMPVLVLALGLLLLTVVGVVLSFVQVTRILLTG
jgi:rhomboid protease GluP